MPRWRAGVGEVLGDLDAQLAGGHHDQRLRHVAAAVGGLALGGGRGLLGRRGDALQQRHAEAQRLARAGAGLADDVLAGQGQRQGQLLDGERADDAGLGQRLDDLGPHTQLGEGGGIGLDRRVRLQRVGLVGLLLCGVLGGSARRVVVQAGQDDRLSPRTGCPGRFIDHRRWRRWESRRGAARTMSLRLGSGVSGEIISRGPRVGAHPCSGAALPHILPATAPHGACGARSGYVMFTAVAVGNAVEVA